MSWVTTTVLLYDFLEDMDGEDNDDSETRPIDAINEWLEDEDYGALFPAPEEAANGKMLSAGIFVGAFNYLNRDEFLSVVRQQRWHYPERVQVLLKDEEEPVFTLVKLDAPSSG